MFRRFPPIALLLALLGAFFIIAATRATPFNHGWAVRPDYGGASLAPIVALAHTPDGDIWLAVQGSGLYRLHEDKWERIIVRANDHDIPQKAFETMFVDDEGRLWVGSQDVGALRIAPDGIWHITQQQGLDDNFVTAAFLWLPGVGAIPAKWALLGVIFLTLFAALVGYISWNAALRWHSRRQAVGRRFNPYIAGSPIRSAEMFYGRSDLLQNIAASLINNSLMIHGERRIGKTSILYRLMDELRHLQDETFHFFPIFIDLEGVPEEEFYHQLMEGLLDALQDELRGFPVAQKLQYHLLADGLPYTDRHMRRDLRQIVSYLKKQNTRPPRIIFLLDEGDTLSAYSSLTQQQFRRILQDVFARNVGVVIAGVHINKAWDREESPWYNMFVELVAPPFTRQEAEALMREPVRGIYEWEEDAVAFVWQYSRGRPHRIQQIAREAVDIMLDEQRRRITLSDVRRAYRRIVFAERYGR